MSNNLISRVKDAEGRTVTHGRYSYRLDICTGDISRCLSKDMGRSWIGSDGRTYDAWQIVARA